VKIVEDNLGWVVDTWQERGIFHGFLGRAVDVARSKESWREYFSVPLYLLHQVHGAEWCEFPDQVRDGECSGEADGWLTSLAPRAASDSRAGAAIRERFALGIKTADCVPVLLYSPDSELAASLHCGWRSVVLGIVPQVLRQIRSRGGARLEIAIGPAALQCCYEVQGDVAQTILSQGGPGAVVKRAGRLYADLHSAIAWQFEREWGGYNLRLCRAPVCTMCDERLFSHRRQGAAAGRQVSFIGV
jgi:copper oxidase (laccase) domain-containing protein